MSADRKLEKEREIVIYNVRLEFLDRKIFEAVTLFIKNRKAE